MFLNAEEIRPVTLDGVPEPAPVVECDHRFPDYVYDANGWKRWCSRCGAPLNFTEPGPWNWRQRLAVVAVLICALALAVCLCVAYWLVHNTQPGTTPSPTPFPPASGPVIG